MKNKIKIAVIIEGGNVVSINANRKDIDVVIIDHDNFDIGLNPVSKIMQPERVSENLYELYDTYSPVQDVEVREQLKKMKF